MPSAPMTWNEWEITPPGSTAPTVAEDQATFDECAEALFNLTPSYGSTIQRLRDDDGNPIRVMQVYTPEGVPPLPDVRAGDVVVLVGAVLQVMTPAQYTAWRS